MILIYKDSDSRSDSVVGLYQLLRELTNELFTLCISNVNASNFLTWYLFVDKIQTIAKKLMSFTNNSQM